MNILLNNYTDLGEITYSSVLIPSSAAKAPLESAPTYWVTTTTAYSKVITGTCTIGEDMDAPIDSFMIKLLNPPVGTVKLTLYGPSSILHTDTIDMADGWNIFTLPELPVVSVSWGLEFISLAGPFYIAMSRVLGGTQWRPNRGATSNMGIALLASANTERYRSGGSYKQPVKKYKELSLSYEELDHSSLFALQDLIANSGSNNTVFAYGLTGTTAEELTKVYGRIKELSKPVKGVSGNYSINVIIEECL